MLQIFQMLGTQPELLDTDFIRVEFYVQYPYLLISSIKGVISPSIKYTNLKYAHCLLRKQLYREVQDNECNIECNIQKLKKYFITGLNFHSKIFNQQFFHRRDL